MGWLGNGLPLDLMLMVMIRFPFIIRIQLINSDEALYSFVFMQFIVINLKFQTMIFM